MFNFFKKDKSKKVYKIENMHCASCAMVIESELEDAGVNASCSWAKQTLEVKDSNVSDEKIRRTVEKAGYKLAK